MSNQMPTPFINFSSEGFKTKTQPEDKTESNTKIVLVRNVLRDVRRQIDNALQLLELEHGEDLGGRRSVVEDSAELRGPQRIMEGVFDGANMVGGDGERYHVPPNYASKSKLVEGDIMKLTITGNGTFIFKQIGPIERNRLVGELVQDDATRLWCVAAEGKRWQVLTASVTFFHGEAGDEAVILVPRNMPSKWAAIENIVKRSPEIL